MQKKASYNVFWIIENRFFNEKINHRFLFLKKILKGAGTKTWNDTCNGFNTTKNTQFLVVILDQ